MPAINEIYAKNATSDKLNSVVYATNLSFCSQNAGLFAMHIAACLSARLLIVHAFTLSQSGLEVETLQSRPSRQRHDLNSLLAGKTALLSPGNVDAIANLLEGSPQEVVPQFANLHSPSLIVMGAHDAGRFGRGVFASVSEQILWSSPLPSLTVGPKVPLISSSTFSCNRLLYITNYASTVGHAAEFAVSFAGALGAEINTLSFQGEIAVLKPVPDDHESARSSDLSNSNSHVAPGKAHDRILEVIKERSIDMLVLGIQKTSRFGIEKRTPGVFQLIADAECPVLTVRT